MVEKEERPPTNEEIIELRDRTKALVSEIEEGIPTFHKNFGLKILFSFK